ncbi:competence type IV pilus major pilin ComGC [Fervidibacillus halotolerans]|uniref:ComG operon protein 3 n=1 Tax=Fervidibacillus halotolerans TaxID=2980027 RepID=A0A9E8RXR5_9BACI|nr:competence type IV pilus major pilin ComGC [Fervidibacillus halotolerans]WAA11448.1 competence type IV pilus major pilin ComGC [Fervidibacillus halotolerans]
MKNEKGFTLIEMMIVLFVVTILLLITIPNVTKNQKSISEKGCDGMVKMVQAQIQAYYIDKQSFPTSISDLMDEEYLEENPVCPDGSQIHIKEGSAYVEKNTSD